MQASRASQTQQQSSTPSLGQSNVLIMFSSVVLKSAQEGRSLPFLHETLLLKKGLDPKYWHFLGASRNSRLRPYAVPSESESAFLQGPQLIWIQALNDAKMDTVTCWAVLSSLLAPWYYWASLIK